MFMRISRVLLVVLFGLGWLVAPVSATTISYQYKYDTVDGAGAAAFQPQTSGVSADSTHNASLTTYSSGELSDGYSFVGGYGSGFWDSGKQVGTRNTSKPTAKVAPSIVALLDQTSNLDTISVNYVVDSRVGVHAPTSATAYFSSNGTTWSAGTIFSGWNDANPSRQGDTPISDLYVKTLDVSGITAAHTAKYVRLDVRSTNEWGGLVELSFTAIPEPGAIVLLATGLLGLLAYAWRRRK